jgi:hypothetical protein
MNTITTTVINKNRDRKFIIVLFLTVICVVFAGFARTYYLNALFAQRTLAWIVRLHGGMFTAWFGLFLLQITLVATGRTDLHRRVGVAGVALACVIIPLSFAVSIHAAKYGFHSAPPNVPALIFLVVPFFDSIVFGILVTAGLLYRGKPQIHKRLMILSTLGILTPAVARIPLHFVRAYGILPVFAMADSFALAYIVYDTISHKRLHLACLWGGLLIVLSAPLRFIIGGSGAWLIFAKWVIQ